MKTVADLMITQLHSLTTESSIADARELMRQHSIRNVPILDPESQRFVGIVNQRDMLRQSFALVAETGLAGLTAREQDIRVTEIMATDVITTSADTSLLTAGRYCLENKHGCLPVLDEQDRLLGILTPSDFVRLCVNFLEAAEH
ncbi:CBS domain-containing protein [Pokkaliibacter sp. CJK22405]|uniref:CBS domain-containing protein n=1 Tax=Pokkaliibacter sp. CJK22405 TaxID=3384615 RepID=UPI0039856A86